jgi:hypothetical protein
MMQHICRDISMIPDTVEFSEFAHITLVTNQEACQQLLCWKSMHTPKVGEPRADRHATPRCRPGVLAFTSLGVGD